MDTFTQQIMNESIVRIGDICWNIFKYINLSYFLINNKAVTFIMVIFIP